MPLSTSRPGAIIFRPLLALYLDPLYSHSSKPTSWFSSSVDSKGNLGGDTAVTSKAHLTPPALQGPSSTMTTCCMDASAESQNWELQVTLLSRLQGKPHAEVSSQGLTQEVSLILLLEIRSQGAQQPKVSECHLGSVKLKRRLHAARPPGRGHSDPESQSSKPNSTRGISQALPE